MEKPGSKNGFTLIEVLIAISVFSLIGIASYTLLATVIDVNAATSDQGEQLKDLQLTFAILQQDLAQFKLKINAGEDNEQQPSVGNLANESLNFIRGGRTNPLTIKRDDLLSVAYVLEESNTTSGRTLIRYFGSTSLNFSGQGEPLAEQGSPSGRLELSNNIKELIIRTLGDDGDWSRNWVKPMIAEKSTNSIEADLPLPRAIEITLVHNTYGEVSRIFNIPRGIPVSPPAIADASQ